MKTLDIINDMYLPALNAMYLSVDPDTGKVMMSYGWENDVGSPIAIKEKTLFLPIERALKENSDDVIFFHPLAENVARGDSAVFKTIKIYATAALTYTISNLAYGLMYLANRKDLHESLNTNQTKILQVLPEVDEKTLKALVKFNSSVDMMDHRMVNLFTKRAGIYQGKTFNRVTYVSFPMLTDLLNRKEEAIKIPRKGDIDKLISLFSYILPNFGEEDTISEYSAPSTSMHAPNFQSMMTAFLNVSEQLQKLLRIYKTAFKKVPELEHILEHLVDLEPLSVIKDSDKYINLIPVLAGNEGPPSVRETKLGSDVIQRPKSVPPTNAMSKVNLDMNNQQFSQEQIGNGFNNNQGQQQNNGNGSTNNNFMSPEQWQAQQTQQQQQNQQNFQNNMNNQNGFNNNQGFNGGGFNGNFNGNSGNFTQRKQCVGGPTHQNVMGNVTHGQGNVNGFNNGFNNNQGFNNGFNNMNNLGFVNNQNQGVNPNDALGTWNQSVNNQNQQQAYMEWQKQQYMLQQQQAFLASQQGFNGNFNNQGFNGGGFGFNNGFNNMNNQQFNGNQQYGTFNGSFNGGGQTGFVGGGFKTK